MSRAAQWRLLGSILVLAGLALIYRPIFSGRVIAGRDVYRLFIPDAHFLLECLRHGELPLWSPHQRLGQPFAATLYSQAFYPPHLLLLLATQAPARAIAWGQLLHAALATGGALTLCRRLGASTPAALVGAAAFGLGPMLTHLATQRNVVDSAAWAPWMVLAAVELPRAPRRATAMLAMFTALSFLAGSPETLLWEGAVVASTLAWRRGSTRSTARLATGLAWGAALACVVAVPALELARNSTRSGGSSDQLLWSVSPPGALSMALFSADLPRDDYWGGDQSFIPTLFLGTTVCALAGFALVGRARSRAMRRGLAAAALLLVLLSMGAHFPPAAWVLKAPVLNLFRFPAKYAVGAGFCIAILAALGVDRLGALTRKVEASTRRLAIAVGAGVLSGALALLLARALHMRVGATPAIAWASVFLTAGAAIFFAARSPARARKVCLGIAGLVVLELAATHGLLGMSWWLDAATLERPSPLAAHIPRPFAGRISVELSGDQAHALGGAAYAYVERSRAALVPLRFVEENLSAIEGYGAPEPARIGTALSGSPRGVFDLAGVSYFVRREAPPFPDLELVASEPDLPRLYHSSTAMPRAFVLHDARRATDEESLAALRDPLQPARKTVFLAEGEPLSSGAGCTSRAEFEAAEPRALDIAVDACAEGYLVVADAYFPGWRATLDGADVPILRADYLLRAVKLPAGRHAVRMFYAPRSFTVGATISVLALLAWVTVIVRSRKASP